MTPADFWNRVQPGGLTVEQELVAFWQHMKDCPCKDKHPAGGGFAPRRRQRRGQDDDDDVLLFLLR